MDVFVLGSYVSAHSIGVDRIPRVGESVLAKQLWVEQGGKGLNFAVALHRLGMAVHTLLMAGNDAAGDALLACLQAEGMQTGSVIRVGQFSGFGIGLVAADGSNIIAVYPGANALMSAEHVDTTGMALAACKLVCAQFEIPDEPILQAFRLARQAGRHTLLSPSPWRPLADELWALTDILVLNEAEALALFGMPGQEGGMSVADWLALPAPSTWLGEWLVVTLAERGCVGWQGADKAIHVAAWPCVAQDPTGAGDAFAAGLARGWLQGQSLADALTFANACGAVVAGAHGVLPALPSVARVAGFMAAGSVSG